MWRLVALITFATVAISEGPCNAQDQTVTFEQFRDLDSAAQRTALVALFTRATDANASTIIGAMLRDPNPTLRETALAVVVSRASAPLLARVIAGPVSGPAAPAAAETSSRNPEPVSLETLASRWGAERAHLISLRPEIVRLLSDPNEMVRERAVSAIASLDLSATNLQIELSDDTQQTLVQHFYSESSARVKRRIVAGFAAEPGEASGSVKELIATAFVDPHASVRAAAVEGAGKFSEREATRLLAERLNDLDSVVRSEAAKVLSRFASAAREIRSDVEAALSRETDPETRQSILRLLDTIGRNP